MNATMTMTTITATTATSASRGWLPMKLAHGVTPVTT